MSQKALLISPLNAHHNVFKMKVYVVPIPPFNSGTRLFYFNDIWEYGLHGFNKPSFEIYSTEDFIISRLFIKQSGNCLFTIVFFFLKVLTELFVERNNFKWFIGHKNYNDIISFPHVPLWKSSSLAHFNRYPKSIY